LDSNILSLFNDVALIKRIKSRLPYLFQLAELESSRAGKIGMEVGSLREKIIIALLIYKFGENNVETDIPITQAEIDVKLFGNPISIKTITGKIINGIKLIWTVDPKSALYFRNNYDPNCDMILINIVWNNIGYFYYIPLSVQSDVLNKIGRERYIKLPKQGTNPRGVEMSKEAVEQLINHNLTKNIPIIWTKSNIEYKPYERWIDLWKNQ
jgi:hypothetical protein